MKVVLLALLLALFVHWHHQPVAAPQAQTQAQATPTPEKPPTIEILDFGAGWCVPCREMKPALEGLPVKTIDIDQNPDLKAQYAITRVPTLVMLVNGKEVRREVGKRTKEQLEGWLKATKEWAEQYGQ